MHVLTHLRTLHFSYTVCVCVCVCVFPWVSQQQVLISVNSTTDWSLLWERTVFIVQYERNLCTEYGRNFVFKMLKDVSVSPIDVTWLSEFWVSYLCFVTCIVCFAPHYNTIVN